MAGERIKLTVKERDSRGSADARRLRKQGFIPGVLYGKGKSSYAIAVPERELRRVLSGAGGLHAILDVVLEGQSTTHASILKDYQQDPIRGHISHIDLHEVRLDQAIQASVNVQLVGEPAGAKEGGVLSQVQREINVEALPSSLRRAAERPARASRASPARPRASGPPGPFRWRQARDQTSPCVVLSRPHAEEHGASLRPGLARFSRPWHPPTEPGGSLMRLPWRRGERASSLELLVVGLGNPGREYAGHRHNVGWMVVEELARRHGASWRGKFNGQVAELG